MGVSVMSTTIMLKEKIYFDFVLNVTKWKSRKWNISRDVNEK